MREIVPALQALLTPGGRKPFKNSPARVKYDELEARLGVLKQQARDLNLNIDPRELVAPFTAPAPAAAAPAPTPPAAPAASADLTQRIADLKAQWQQAAAENNAERMR